MRGIIFSGCLSVFVLSAAFSESGVSGRESEQVAQTYLDQGWSVEERRAWYSATQGSRLMPASWFKSLEVPNSEQLFNSVENMDRYRFVYENDNVGNPYPIGFAEDGQSDLVFEKTKLRWIDRDIFSRPVRELFSPQSKYEKWIGFNCAACHTSIMKFGGDTIQVEGGASLIDFQLFEEEVANSLRKTLDNDEKFKRFASRVGSFDKGVDSQKLKVALRKLTEWRELVVSKNATELRYGFSRTDAFGHIFNQVALFSEARKISGGREFAQSGGQIFKESDAPVSFPFLWDTPDHNVVQWNGIAKNGDRKLGIDVGALGRNTGEVFGVFGDVNLNKRTGSNKLLGTRVVSSASVNNLIELERLVARLKSPEWPSARFGSLNRERVNRGQALFKLKCQNCHKPRDRNDLGKSITAQMSLFLPVESLKGKKDFHGPPGTDPAMACRAFERTARINRLYSNTEVDSSDEKKRPIRNVDSSAALLTAMVQSALFDQAGELIYFLTGSKGLIVQNPGLANTTRGGSNYQTKNQRAKNEVVSKKLSEEILQAVFLASQEPSKTVSGNLITPSDNWGPFNSCMAKNASALKAYKARPLNGIWASAPFLHNSSVPNLYELLLPPESRSKSFYIGSAEFDPIKVGYVTHKNRRNTFRFDVYNSDGTIRWGNFNGGHDYQNAELDDSQRWDLVEYMKSL